MYSYSMDKITEELFPSVREVSFVEVYIALNVNDNYSSYRQIIHHSAVRY